MGGEEGETACGQLLRRWISEAGRGGRGAFMQVKSLRRAAGGGQVNQVLTSARSLGPGDLRQVT